ncbi:MAG: NUDIX domain-containing protein [Pseudomonadales bacterium]|nr:NUDIX domain-containing protein [Pseudomonadales bacterium]MCP5185121.1 NUDIX domain-containing protein [Pseudomonadales bacterium]
MSELPGRYAGPIPVQPVRPAATVIIVREAPAGFEIFMLKRAGASAFAGGMYVFPGGRVDADDHLHAYDAWRQGPSQGQAPQQRALGDEWRGFWVAAIRETFEEAGLLLAYNEAGELVSYADAALHARLDALRKPLNDGEVSLLDICARERLRLAVDHVHYYNRFVTPIGRPRRFDTRFFIAETPPGQVGRHDEHETVHSVWISPQEALARNAAGEFDLMNVTRRQLQDLAARPDYAQAVAMARDNRYFPVHRPVLPVAG